MKRNRHTDRTTPGALLKTAAARTNADSKRDLEGVPPYEKENVKYVANLLASISCAFQGVKSALDQFSTLPIDKVSPDGKLGGKGYVIPIKEIKEELVKSYARFSDFKDTLSDELNNQRWGLSDDEKNELLSTKDSIEEATDTSIGEVEQSTTDMVGEGPESSEEATEPYEDEENPFPSVDEADEENQDEVPPEDEISEEKADDLLKLASENKSVFVGLKPNSNPIAKKIASKVLEGLVKRASEKAK